MYKTLKFKFVKTLVIYANINSFLVFFVTFLFKIAWDL